VPELPEVETVRRRLAPHLEGRTIVVARIDDYRPTAPEDREEVAAALTGESVERLDRHGKELVIRLAAGGALVVHLRMTGNLLWLPPGPATDEPRFTRARLDLDDGSAVVFSDIRRFGTWRLVPEPVEDWLTGRLGPDALGPFFTPAWLAGALADRRAPAKAVLLDQRVAAGVGNIYADESLWRARIHPRTPARLVSRARARALHGAVQDVLREGIEAQGASIRDFRTPDGGYGSAQERFAVYGRAGQPCERCGRPLERIVVAQRTSTLCRRCQRERH
jgi:formamidopyrimidine-DNA glycosylase